MNNNNNDKKTTTTTTTRIGQKNAKKYKITEYVPDSQSKNENENTPDNSEYEIEEVEEKNKILAKNIYN